MTTGASTSVLYAVVISLHASGSSRSSYSSLPGAAAAAAAAAAGVTLILPWPQLSPTLHYHRQTCIVYMHIRLNVAFVLQTEARTPLTSNCRN